HHDLDERTNVQRGRGAVEADIGDERAGGGLLVDAREVGALVNVPALLERAEEFGLRLKIGRHGVLVACARFNGPGASAQRVTGVEGGSTVELKRLVISRKAKPNAATPSSG